MLKRGYKKFNKKTFYLFFKVKKEQLNSILICHGHGNLDKAINVMNEKDKLEFKNL